MVEISPDQLASLAHSDFLSYCQIVDPKSSIPEDAYQVNWHHEVIATRLQRAYEDAKKGIDTRLIIAMPPRHGKSETATIRFPSWVLGRDPNWPIIVTAYGHELAGQFGERTRDLMQDPRYQYVFNTRLKPGSASKNDWQVVNADGTPAFGSYTSVGVGGAVTGKGARLAIIDDPFKNREEAESPRYRQRAWDFYSSTLSTRLQGKGNIIVVIATRWHTYDLTGRLIEDNEKRRLEGRPYTDWELISFPAIATEDEPHRLRGEALWPQRVSLDQLERIRENSSYDWAALYQQNPILSENQVFGEHMWRYYEEEDINPNTYARKFTYHTIIDPAISSSATADNTVVLTVAKEVFGEKMYRIRETAGRFSPGETIGHIFDHYNDFHSRVFIETVAFQKMMKLAIEEEQRNRNVYFKVHEVNTRSNKEIRIEGLIPFYERGVIFHRPTTDKEYEMEALEFPRGKHDDRIDAMSIAVQSFSPQRKQTGGKRRQHRPHFTGYNRTS